MEKPKSGTLIFRENLAKLIAANGRNPNAAADKLGFPQRTLDRWRKGERIPGLAELEALATKVGIAPWQLLVDGLEVSNPPMLESESARLREFMERLKQIQVPAGNVVELDAELHDSGHSPITQQSEKKRGRRG